MFVLGSFKIREKEGGSVPVLFIPGNAGSSHQVRSIASSATRQYYSSPYVVASDFASRSLKPLDFFAGAFILAVCLHESVAVISSELFVCTGSASFSMFRMLHVKGVDDLNDYVVLHFLDTPLALTSITDVLLSQWNSMKTFQHSTAPH